MCGIWGFLGQNEGYELKGYVNALSPRGPEYIAIQDVAPPYMTLGFTRLAINGLSPAGHQPLERNGIYVVCNGEIYNYKTLAERWNIPYTSDDSDCVVLAPLYSQLKMTLLCRALDGVFALILVDTKRNVVYVARDPYGVRPLFEGRLGAGYMWSSELKGLHTACTEVRPFPPGTWQCHDLSTGRLLKSHKYHDIPSVSISALDEDASKHLLRGALIRAVRKRLLSDRPIGALLSGGVDSSLIAAIVSREISPRKLQTFSIGFEGSPDLKYARMVADKIGSIHYEIVVTPEDFQRAVPEVVKAIESYDITTVRASVGNWMVGKYIKENTDCKVIFNGDGSDEIGGGYKYMRFAPSDEEFEAETERLLSEIHLFDVLRSDRSMAAHGLEARTPFLDKQVVALWKSTPVEFRRTTAKRMEKLLLRDAFLYDNYLPTEVLYRKKEAFSDGVSSAESKPWYARPDEAKYYKDLFSENYRPWESVIPHMWMPRWISATDPSARQIQ
jgi:asparagine synthase (glutamine-hydrolysing)